VTRTVIPVILSGGSGTRLWPLSRAERPKQFLRLVGEQTLLQDTLARTRGLGERLGPPIIVCNAVHRFLVAEQLLELGIEPQAIVLEPAGRNTAPAVAVAALLARNAAAPGAEPILLVLPADHVIRDRAAFTGAVETAIDAAAAGNLVTFGIVPDSAETGYGYIAQGEAQGSWSLVERFVEKPDLVTAESYLASGRYLWNSGMFVFSADAYLRELGRHAPAIVEACSAAIGEAHVDSDFTRLGDAFEACPSDSIDYAVMENTDRAVVVALDAGWSDVGSWAALRDVLESDRDGNVLRGNVIVDGCSRSYVSSETRLVAVLGLDEVIVVETHDAVLVSTAAHCQRVKRVAESLDERRSKELQSNDSTPSDL
jgi:mannose-1-phosphate guanylyltransferase / mannose-6-phosphate isomerase